MKKYVGQRDEKEQGGICQNESLKSVERMKYSGSKWLLPCFPLIFTDKKTSMNMASLGENKALILHTALSTAEDSDQ